VLALANFLYCLCREEALEEHKTRMSNQVQNQPTAAYWLSMIGGILGLIVSIVFFILGAIGLAAYNSYSDLFNGYGDYGYGYDYGASALGWGFALYFALGVWCIITSIIVIICARRLKANPMAHGKYGLIILIFSIIGVGSLFGFIGGILAIVYKPIPVGAAPQYPPQQPYYGPPPQQATNCPQCGTMVQPGVRFCPNCGKQQY